MNREEDSKPPAKHRRADTESDTQEDADGPNPFTVPDGPSLDPEGEKTGPFTMNEHIKMLREAMRQAAIDVDADRWDNILYHYLQVVTTTFGTSNSGPAQSSRRIESHWAQCGNHDGSPTIL
jgi:hypothetical protein